MAMIGRIIANLWIFLPMWDGRKDGLPSPRVPLIYINLPRLERRNLGGDAVPVRAYCGHHWRMVRDYPARAYYGW